MVTMNETQRRVELGTLAREPWAIWPDALRRMVAAVERGDAAIGREHAEREVALSAALQRSIAGQPGAVAVLPMFGRISMRGGGMMSMLFGGTPLDRFMAGFRAALGADEVKAIVIDVDSPGGSVDGVPEAADELFASRGRKPIVAVADTWAASAAYWLASQADELVVTPSGEVGSIGVFMMHVDESRLLEAEGIDVTLISAGKFKTEGNPFEPLTDEAREHFQGQVDGLYGIFVQAVARGRGVSAGDVRSGFGEGRMVAAKDAVKARMADRVATLDETLKRLGVGRSAGPSADVERRQLEIARARRHAAEAEARIGARSEGPVRGLTA